MKSKSQAQGNRGKATRTPDEGDFAKLDTWARALKLSDGRALTATARREEKMARSVGRPRKAESDKARRLMISMTPGLIKSAGRYAKRTGRTLSGLIAESLEETMRRRAS